MGASRLLARGSAPPFAGDDLEQDHPCRRKVLRIDSIGEFLIDALDYFDDCPGVDLAGWGERDDQSACISGVSLSRYIAAPFKTRHYLASGLSARSERGSHLTDGDRSGKQAAEHGGVAGSVIVIALAAETFGHLADPTPPGKCQEIAEQRRPARRSG